MPTRRFPRGLLHVRRVGTVRSPVEMSARAEQTAGSATGSRLQPLSLLWPEAGPVWLVCSRGDQEVTYAEQSMQSYPDIMKQAKTA